MLVFRLVLLTLGAVLVVTGCRSSSETADGGEAATAAADSGMVYTRAVHVLVDGNDVGVVPRTVRIRRSFGTREVTLWQAGEEIRTYEIEMVHTADGIQTQQGFWSTTSAEGETYDVRNLPTSDDSTFQVPFSAAPIRIEDQDFGVTLLVSD